MPAKKNKKEMIPVKHRDCVKAILMQWGNNPIIAECKRTGERYVANSICKCPDFEFRFGDENIIKKSIDYE